MKNKIFTGLALLLFACSLAIFVSSCEKSENDPLPYMQIPLNR